MNRPRRAASSRPARRRKLPRAERERQMLDAAGRVFARRGYHAASMDQVERPSGAAAGKKKAPPGGAAAGPV